VESQPAQLQQLLKRYFGFDAFRPLQEQIISDSLAGKDVFALLPTGGGKSLCFQLPALVRPGLTVVISPLIALMKDQVDALQAAGVPAAFLNSSLGSGESRPILRGLHNGEFRLLYVAPERLLLSGFLEDLSRWNVNLFAIDEAHCISEWGHDFRPEYRQLTQLRAKFPNVPFMALTATATDRVRADILRQLQFKEPRIYVASFNRPNLNYRVTAKAGAYEQILEFVRAKKNDAGIIYCQARKTAEQLAARLNSDGVGAAAYHAGLDSDERARNQEAFLRDEVRVVCATIAFGMGINKPNVRFVIHHDLPKNVESYYQETGRAGRDGLPSECLLLFSAGDRVKYSKFIDEKPDAKERDNARAQLEQIVHYAEGSSCRRAFLLNYFGESFDEENCGACDNCLSPRETWDGTLAAQKFLSCVYRIKEKGGFGVGVTHVVEVLSGANTDKIRSWQHDKLSTYGIGKEHSRAEWSAIGRELVRLGLLRQNAEKFNILELTDEGRAVLKTRQKITLTRAMAKSEPSHRVGEISCDEALFETLRQLRKRLADERAVPSYIIFSDVSLRQMAREYPQTEIEFTRISGVGEKKLREFGEIFLGEIRNYLSQNARQIFADDSFSVPAKPKATSLSGTTFESLRLFREGNSVDEIAKLRGLAVGTIYGHLSDAIELGQELEMDRFFGAREQEEIGAAFAKFGFANLRGALESLGGKFIYGQLRVFRALKNRQQTG
jgi:ATP-dependent DNA helicase RecQ